MAAMPPARPGLLITAKTQRWSPEELLRTLVRPRSAGTGNPICCSPWDPPRSTPGHRVRHYSAADLVDTLYRGRSDNSVGKIIDTLLRHELIIVDQVGFAPLGDTGAQLLFRFVAAAMSDAP
jgi:DNA replication protein DnaC